MLPDPAVKTTLAEWVRTWGAHLPLPGHGQTVRRWSIFAQLAATDLSIAKLFESHADAVAILAESSCKLRAFGADDDELLGVWAAESAAHQLIATPQGLGSRDLRLNGSKEWCSGAALVSSALVTARTPDGQRILAWVPLHDNGVQLGEPAWRFAGMHRTATATLTFCNAAGFQIGDANFYLERPGFWHGAAGIAACWLGGCFGLRAGLAAAATARPSTNLDTHLGVVDSALAAARALTRETAVWIDEHPRSHAELAALRLRCAVEHTVERVQACVSRALGPRALTVQSPLAELFADLPVFVRQSHAERDWARAGTLARIHPDAGVSL
ncbi:acyl-CoA dehydrogenase [Ralstonia pickettii]|uniref:acyl-CoA dehydrogenase n=1 Tax=Ralstonia pickettii TaxID=329 RepID=UPI0027149122|nr:acyl-CoA dehydrogenase [Ralstonia pickettii]WKZ86470.1 acyl-CoA dehydrogenase [Ralstonia pickettii]